MATPGRRPELPAIPRPSAESFSADNDDVMKRRLRDAGSPLGFGRRASVNQAPAPAPTALLTPCKSFNLSIPEYLFDELGLRAVKRRVTKRYLILDALAKAGFTVEPHDLEEDGRRRRR